MIFFLHERGGGGGGALLGKLSYNTSVNVGMMAIIVLFLLFFITLTWF